MTKRREMVENGDDKQRAEYAEIRNIIKKKARNDTRKYYKEIVRETIMGSKSLKKFRRTQKLGQDRLITLIDKQGRITHDQDKVIEIIEEFYTDSKQITIIHTDPEEVPEIT